MLRPRVVLPICILVLALVVLPGCRAVNEGMFYDDMKEAFPRFRVARADYSESPGFMGEGGGVTVTFELESVDVPGFRLEGLYYVLDDPSRESQMQVYRRTIFSGKVISRSSVTNFERLWLSLRLPPIGVSRDVWTGLNARESVGPMGVAAKFRNYEQRNVYTFSAGPDLYFFFLDPKTREWRYLPGYQKQ